MTETEENVDSVEEMEPAFFKPLYYNSSHVNILKVDRES